MAAAFRIADGIGATAGPGTTTFDSNSITLEAGDTVYVMVVSSDVSPVVCSSVQWDPSGVNEAFTKIYDPGAADFTFGRMTVWRAQGLTAKTGIIQATWANEEDERLLITWVGTGIDTTTPEGTIVAATNTDTSVTVTANTTAGQLVLGMAWAFDASPSAGALSFTSPNGTERVDAATVATDYDAGAAQDIAASGTTQAITWTISETVTGWRAVAIPLNDLAASGRIFKLAGYGGGLVGPYRGLAG